jgi:hypothetical protein
MFTTEEIDVIAVGVRHCAGFINRKLQQAILSNTKRVSAPTAFETDNRRSTEAAGTSLHAPQPALLMKGPNGSVGTHSGHFKSITRTRCFACAIMRAGALAGGRALARAGHHPFGSLAFDSGFAMVEYEIGRGTFTIGFAESPA